MDTITLTLDHKQAIWLDFALNYILDQLAQHCNGTNPALASVLEQMHKHAVK